jgi:hypothetical protein
MTTIEKQRPVASPFTAESMSAGIARRIGFRLHDASAQSSSLQIMHHGLADEIAGKRERVCRKLASPERMKNCRVLHRHAAYCSIGKSISHDKPDRLLPFRRLLRTGLCGAAAIEACRRSFAPAGTARTPKLMMNQRRAPDSMKLTQTMRRWIATSILPRAVWFQGTIVLQDC